METNALINLGKMEHVIILETPTLLKIMVLILTIMVAWAILKKIN